MDSCLSGRGEVYHSAETGTYAKGSCDNALVRSL